MTSDNELPAYRFARGILRPTLTALTRRDWRGQEHLPRVGGCVVAANHVSHFDPFTFAHFVNDAGRAPRFLAKAQVFDIPVFGAIVRNAGQIPVYRESADAAGAFQAAVDAIAKGECVVIYPEATLTRDPDLWPMAGKSGAARIALTTGCPVIPVAQWGPNEVLAPYARAPKLFPRKVMHVWAGPAVDLDDLRGRDQSAEVLREGTNRITGAITGLLAQIRGEPAPEKPYDMRDHDVPRIGNPRKGRRRREGH